MVYPINKTFEVLGNRLLKNMLVEKKGARWAGRRERNKFLNRSNTGLVVNGADRKLSDEDSFQNVCVIARPRMGKTTKYVIPNVLDRAQYDCSIVVNDPSGEIYDQTSAHMHKCGFRVIVINVNDPTHSHRFNPLLEIESLVDLEQLARIIIESGSSSENSRDPFWNQGATRLVTYLLKTLLNASRENLEYFSLANLYHLLQNFGDTGEGLAEYIGKYTQNPNNPDDTSLRDEWFGQTAGADKTLQSILSTSLIALHAMSNPALGYLTSKSTIDLKDLRRERTIIYFVTPSQHAEYYSFFTSLFFQSVFNMAMRELPGSNDKSIYVLADEFGHMKLPTVDTTVNTIRKYRVSLSIILQTISQLENVYGSQKAQTILGGFATYITYGASDHPTIEFFQKTIGKVREITKESLEENKSHINEYSLLEDSELRTLAQDVALLVASDKHPVLMQTMQSFENPSFKKALSLGAYPFPTQQNIYNAPKVPLQFS